MLCLFTCSIDRNKSIDIKIKYQLLIAVIIKCHCQIKLLTPVYVYVNLYNITGYYNWSVLKRIIYSPLSIKRNSINFFTIHVSEKGK